MTPQSLKDPRAEAAAVDPTVELAREHRAAIDRHSTDVELSDDAAADEFMDNVIVPLEEKLARTRPTTREGIIAALDVAAREERRHCGGPPSGTEAMVIGVMENARDALKAGVGTVEEAGPDDPFSAWLAEWEVAQAEAERLGEELADDDDGDQQLGEFIDRRVSPVNDKLVNTPARTVAGVVIKARFAGRLGECGHAPPEALLATIFAGAEHVMRGPGVVVEMSAGPDPLVALWSEWDGIRKNATAPADVTDEEAREAFTAGVVSQMEAIEERIMAAVPSTLAGALVQMSVLSELGTTEIAPPKKDIDAALAAIVAGQGDVPASSDPLVALYREWQEVYARCAPEGISDDDSESFYEGVTTALIDLETRIMASPTRTLDGAYIQFAILNFWNHESNAVPTSADDVYATFKRRVEQRVAGLTGATS